MVGVEPRTPCQTSVLLRRNQNPASLSPSLSFLSLTFKTPMNEINLEVSAGEEQSCLTGINALEFFSLDQDSSQGSGRGHRVGWFWTWGHPAQTCARLQGRLKGHKEVLTIAWRSYQAGGLEPRKRRDWGFIPSLGIYQL